MTKGKIVQIQTVIDKTGNIVLHGLDENGEVFELRANMPLAVQKKHLTELPSKMTFTWHHLQSIELPKR